ncbi:MAG: 4-hydroxy-tetrahydrodipicolinate reductase [Rhodospirillaceae bacterium]|nr:4-hydroxy-tetrahydrodipicolinate reductase [Rhodospirillaceae bacterium]
MNIGVIGCAGRMGRMLVRTILATDGCAVAGGTEAPGAPAVGRDLGTVAGIEPLGLPVGDDPAALIAAADAVLEFTTPAASLAHVALSAAAGRPHVLGTTGFDDEQVAALERHAARIPIVWAPNMSLGVNLLLGLVRQVARALDPAWDIEIVEMHHRMKVDAPSGTALALGRAAAEGRGVAFEAAARRTRDGIVGARPRGEIGFATLRGGDVVGEHTVIFAADGERVELAHKATSREIFARGAVRAALWVHGRPPGLYGMADVLGL